MEGFQQAEIITSIKHFPGHGDVEIDSHVDLPILTKSKEELMQCELVPFFQLTKYADTVMTAHILVRSIDPHMCATLSPAVLRILREEIGFEGAIITDSLFMEGAVKNAGSVEEATIQALAAGCDILLLGGRGAHSPLKLTVEDVERIHQALVKAVKEGRIPESRLDEAVARVLELKAKYATKRQEHAHLAEKIAARSVKVAKKGSRIPDFEKKKLLVVAPVELRSMLEEIPLSPHTSYFFFHKFNPSQKERERTIDMAGHADIVVFVSVNAWRWPAQAELMRSLKIDILIILENPLDGDLCEAGQIITTFSPCEASLREAYKLIRENND